MNTPQTPETTAVFENIRDYTTLEPLTQQESDCPHVYDTLDESEASYRVLFESNPHPMWIVDSETLRFLLVNKAAIEHYGYSKDEFLAMTIMDIRPAEDVPLLSKVVLQAQRSKAPNKGKRGVWRYKTKDGQVLDVEITLNSLRFRGRMAQLVMANDITESRRIERALQRSELEQRQLAEHLEKERERLAEAQAIAKVGSWEQDLTTDVLTWSEETYRIFGMDPFGAKISLEACFARV
ncbi:MAG: multi-sensor signal transduction histidine kinase, partial [Chthonomonadales bacterium]|nr:multi-sensor signal transduction histidine kinase [Chthonomonadales bacterium]